MKRKLKAIEEAPEPQQKVKVKKKTDNGTVDVLMVDRLRGPDALNTLKELATAGLSSDGDDGPVERFVREGGGANDLLHLLVDVDKAEFILQPSNSSTTHK